MFSLKKIFLVQNLFLDFTFYWEIWNSDFKIQIPVSQIENTPNDAWTFTLSNAFERVPIQKAFIL